MKEQANGVVEEPEVRGIDALARLEERILETVEQLRIARREKAQAETEIAALREQLAESERQDRKRIAELDSFRAERRQILERVEKLLSHIDTLSQG